MLPDYYNFLTFIYDVINWVNKLINIIILIKLYYYTNCFNWQRLKKEGGKNKQ